MNGQPIKRKPNKPSYYSNVPISQGIPAVEEIKQMGGFAWTEDGIRPALAIGAVDDALGQLRAASEQIEMNHVQIDENGNAASG